VTAVGDVEVERRYYACRSCRNKQMPWDVWAGTMSGHLSLQAQRLAALAGGSWSFDIASDRLYELCGIRLSDETIRKVTEAVGDQARQWLLTSDVPVEAMQASPGNAEFYTDGTSVNTREGWREMRLSVWAKRPAGEPATPAEWATRSLPKPTARWICAGIDTSDTLGPLWSKMAERIGATDGRGVSVLADGAKWIWKNVAEYLPRSECVVDVFHVSEHLHACGRSLHGDHTEAARQWADRHLDLLLASGPMALLRALQSAQAETSDDAKRHSLEELIAYLKPNIDSLRYGDRLRRGLPIGSGMVEGACKTVVGRRLKCNGARWTAANADRMAALCGLHYSDQWEAYWLAVAA